MVERNARIDLSGQRFGKLVAKEYVPRERRWKCLCDCGNEKLVVTSSLRSGKTKSCGCARHDVNAPNFIDLTGKRFGKLTAIQRVETKNRKKSLWLCRCDCGNTSEVLSENLRKGATKSCGCARYDGKLRMPNIAGQRFGRLVAEKMEYAPYGKTRWVCKCDCGNEKSVLYKSLKRGDVKSCGCYKREVTSERTTIDMSPGDKYGRLTIMSKDEKRAGGCVCWICACECGRIVSVSGNQIRSGSTKSCGCYQREINGNIHRTHGKSKSKLYSVWSNAKDRTTRKSNSAYERYGGAGIFMCDEWLHDFSAFAEWSMSNGYEEGLSLDRIDNAKGYSPDNCRWATIIEQANNKKNNVRIVIGEETHTIAEWCRIKGVTRGYVDYRRKMNIPPEEWFKQS